MSMQSYCWVNRKSRKLQLTTTLQNIVRIEREIKWPPWWDHNSKQNRLWNSKNIMARHGILYVQIHRQEEGGINATQIWRGRKIGMNHRQQCDGQCCIVGKCCSCQYTRRLVLWSTREFHDKLSHQEAYRLRAPWVTSWDSRVKSKHILYSTLYSPVQTM